MTNKDHPPIQPESPDPQLSALCGQLDSINEKERQLTSNMRRLADQADELMLEIMGFKQQLNVYQPQTAKSLTEPENIVSPAPTPLDKPPGPDSKMSENVTPATRDEIIQQKANRESSSWLDRELANRGTQPEATVAKAVSAPIDILTEPPSPQPAKPEDHAASAHLELEEVEVVLPNAPTTNYETLEMNLGIKWLSRIGIVAILVGLAMALCYSFPNFTREMKLLTGFVLALGFFGGGTKLYQGAPVLGRIMQGGGLAMGYLSLFAVFFIPQVQLIDSSVLGYFLLFAYTTGIMALSNQLNSQTTALLSLAFGYYTAGYAVSYEVAFISTAILMLGNAGLNRLHPEWRVANKANLLGAFWTYSHWCNQASLYNQLPALIYLGYTYALFHIIAVLRANKGDVVLNLLNVVGCYILFKSTQSIYAASSVPEFIVGATQLISLVWVYRQRPEQRDSELSYSLLIVGLLFSGLGVTRFFSPNIKTSVMAGIALCLGLLSKRGIYQKVLNPAAYALILWAGGNLVFHWNALTDTEEMLNGIMLIGSSFVLEATAFRTHHAALRSLLLIYTSLIYFSEIMDAMPAHFRTLAFVVSGFAWLTFGFTCRRKMYRILGLSWIFFIGGCSLVGDFFYLETIYKILLFILLGAGLLAGSYGYVLLEKKLALSALAQPDKLEPEQSGQNE